MTNAITGDLSIVTSNGTVLKDTTDLGLAWQWAESENGSEWADMDYIDRVLSVSDALGALRSSYAESA
jgi:hypothetical protein